MYIPKGTPRNAVKKRRRRAAKRGHKMTYLQSAAGGGPGKVQHALQQIPPGAHERRADVGLGKEWADSKRV